MHNLPKKLSFFSMLSIWARYGDPFIYHYFKDKKVCDIGCGSGRFLVRNPKDYFGIDISQSLVNTCVSKGLNAILGSATDIPVADESIEAINCDNVIEHLSPDNAATMINEFGRVLKEGGIVIIRSPLGENVWNTFSHVRSYPPVAIKKLITKETEDFVRPEQNYLKELRILHIYFQGRYYENRLLYLLSNAWTHFIPWSRKYAYILVIAKTSTL